ncbi:uncharacterized protein LOC127733682 [Mytilus californianus]|uniref:uncharacterized protein LOC127733682 n=1 Tax=Mytilus californianus TaxID=6549 RepID=UPI00224543B8|nr:uncharacterized protein LOC127733682 [Mytilus californianus]
MVIPQNIIEGEKEANEHVVFAFLKDARDTECNKLTDTMNLCEGKNETTNAELNLAKIKAAEAEVLSLVNSANNDECNMLRTIGSRNTYKESLEAPEFVSSKEMTDDEEYAAFYKSIRDAEYNKFVEAYYREKIIKEEKERRRITREQEKIKKQFEEIWKPATELDALRHAFHEKPSASNEKTCTSQELHLKEVREEKELPGPFLSPVKEERIKSFVRDQHYNYQSFQSTDIKNSETDRELDRAVISETVTSKRGSLQQIVKKVFKRSKSPTKDINDKQLALKEELKLDLSTLDDKIEDQDIPDTTRTSDSEWFSISLSDTEESPRPHLRPFFSPVVEEIRSSPITSKTKESAIDIEVDFQSKPNSGFMGFRQWFCQLFCCHSKPNEDVDN